MAGSQLVPAESSVMGIGETPERDGKKLLEGTQSNGIPQDFAHRFQSLSICSEFYGTTQQPSASFTNTPTFSPQMADTTDPATAFTPPTIPHQHSRSVANHRKNTPSTQSSASTPVSYSSTSTPASPRTWLVYRPDKTKKNVIITAFDIKHNIAQLQGFVNADGSRGQFETNMYKDGHYDFLKNLASMGSHEEAKFWARNVIEININIGSLDSALAPNTPTILTQMETLGDRFHRHAEQIHINLDYPTSRPSPGTDMVKQSGRPKAVPRPQDSQPIDVNTPAMILMTSLIYRLTKFKSLTRLAVTMRTPLTSGTSVTAQQLNYVVPFMILEDWSLYWQAVYLNIPQLIPHKSWATRYLGEQWFKVHKDFAEKWVEIKKQYDAKFPGRVSGSPDGEGKRRAWD